MPQIVEILDFVEPFQCIDHSTIAAFTSVVGLTPGPQLNHEAFTIFAADDLLYGPADPSGTGSLILDEFIVNRRAVNVVAGLKFLKGKGGDQLAKILEYTAPDPELIHEPLEELPENWEAMVDEDQREGMLALLNSLSCDASTLAG